MSEVQMRKALLTAIFASSIAAMLLTAGCKSNSAGNGGASTAPTVVLGPEVNAAIPGLDGMDATVAQYKGKVVLVNFWATWCQPCRMEIPWLIEFNEKYGPRGLVILGVAMDDEGKKVVQPWVMNQKFDVNGQQKPMDYRILLGNDMIADKFGGIIGLPTSYLYGRDGKKIKTIIGLINHDDLQKTFDTTL